MGYKADRLNLNEAIAGIQEREGVDGEQARHQLLFALQDGAIVARYFLDPISAQQWVDRGDALNHRWQEEWCDGYRTDTSLALDDLDRIWPPKRTADSDSSRAAGLPTPEEAFELVRTGGQPSARPLFLEFEKRGLVEKDATPRNKARVCIRLLGDALYDALRVRYKSLSAVSTETARRYWYSEGNRKRHAARRRASRPAAARRHG